MIPLLLLLSLTPELTIQNVVGDCAREAVVLEAEPGRASSLRFQEFEARDVSARTCLVTMKLQGVPGFQAQRSGASAKGQVTVAAEGLAAASVRYYASGEPSALFYRSFATPYDGAFLGETTEGSRWLPCGVDAEVNVLVDAEALQARVSVETVQIPPILYRRCSNDRGAASL